LHDSPGGQRFGRASGELPVTHDISDRILRLPLFSDLTHEQVRQVTEAVTGFYRPTSLSLFNVESRRDRA